MWIKPPCVISLKQGEKINALTTRKDESEVSRYIANRAGGRPAFKIKMEERKNKDYWKDGYFYVENRVICGICSLDMGRSDKREGELGYCGCEDPDLTRRYS